MEAPADLEKVHDQLDGIAAESESLSSSGHGESLLAATPVPEDTGVSNEELVENLDGDVDDVTINGHSDTEEVPTPVPFVLPWGGRKERSTFPPGIHIDADLKPGEFVMRTLFAQFTVMVEKKIEGVMTEPLEKPLSKSLQLGEDPSFDQLLTAFGTVAEHCLPSLLRTLFAWYDKQLDGRVNISERVRTDSNKSKSSAITDMPSSMEEEFVQERRDLAVEFVFCLVLIEVLKQLSVHPGHDDLILYIENLAFRHFKYREGLTSSPNYSNHLKIADLYGEVIGVLAQSRFQSVRKRFSQELKELRLREATQPIAQSIISLLMGMKFFRVKMVPIEEFEASFLFLQECGSYFLEVKDKDIKHSLAGLFVDILTPLAAVVKNEVNVPCLKNFVETLYPPTLELCTKNKHKMALFPLVTCLLCVSQKAFFIQNFHYFLAMVLSNLKNKDPQMARIGLESLFRLIWVYMVRIKQPESNQCTTTRLHSIINSLFPKGSKTIVPRDAPPYIFVRIIQYIATEKLEFAMREIIFDLLQVGRTPKIILTPERMNIGLRAFLVIADSLQKKEGDPPMPQHVGSMPSGNTLRIKKTYLNKVLTDDTAKSIGINAFFPHVRKVLSGILRALDSQFGKPLLLTNPATANKEPDELIPREHKPKIDLFRACLAAVPRLIPDGMSKSELVDLLSRLTLHVDEELKTLALQSLQNIVTEFAEWREDTIHGFVQFLIREIPDTSPTLIDSGLRGLLQLVTTWRAVAGSTTTQTNTNSSFRSVRETIEEKSELASRLDPATVLHMTEAYCLVTFCHCRLAPRRISVLILKEVKQILKTLHLTTRYDEPVLDVMDKCCPEVLEKCSSLLPSSERAAMNSVVPDLQWLAERNSAIWTAGTHDDSAVKTVSSQNLSGADPWAMCLFGFLELNRLMTKSVSAVNHSWPIVHSRLSALYSVVDPSPISENRASLLRSTTAVKRPANERDFFVHLWKNYIAFACRVVPRIQSPVLRCISPDVSLSSSPESYSSERHEPRTIIGSPSPSLLHKLLIPLIRCEVNDMREATIAALGMINHEALRDVMDELLIYVREAVDRKSANMRRQKRRDILRLQLVKIFELVADKGTFALSDLHIPSGSDGGHIPSTCVEFIDGMRQCLELDPEKDSPAGKEVRIAYADFVQKLISSFPLESRGSLLKRDLLRQMFNLFSQWSPNFSRGLVPKSSITATDMPRYLDELEVSALRAMCAVVACGPVYDQQVLAEDAPIYSWMDLLLSSRDPRVSKLGRDSVVLLLECNQDSTALLEWVVNRCYTGAPSVSDGCFLGLTTIFSSRPDYPAGNYVAIINVTLLMTGCPRADVQDAALELLPILDRQFFGESPPLTEEEAEAQQEDFCALDTLLVASYSRSQMFLSKQLADLRPELTMRLFSEIMYRLQTARHSARQQLLQYLLPWLCNIELVDPRLPPGSAVDSYQAEQVPKGSCREGWGSVEATEMVVTNLLYVTAKFGDEHPKETEELWAELCSSFPVNLKVILRYLFIMASLSPQDLLPYTKRVCLYIGRARPERLLDELMNELQTVESVSCTIERTSTPPYYRITSNRKSSNGWENSNGTAMNVNTNSVDTCDCTRVDSALSVEKGTIHTKRRSAEDPGKESCTIESGTVRSTITYLTSLASGQPSLYIPPSREGKSSPRSDRARSTPVTPAPVDDVVQQLPRKLVSVDESVVVLRSHNQEVEFFDIPQPRPVPMPEYGGYYGHLTDFLPESSQPVAIFQRYNLALLFINDLVVDGLEGVDWAAHLPLILHMAILGLDNSRALIAENCRNLLISLLFVLTEHNDYSALGKILLRNRAAGLGLRLVLPAAPAVHFDFTDSSKSVDEAVGDAIPIPVPAVANSGTEDNLSDDRQKDDCAVSGLELQKRLSEIIKSLVDFISSKSGQAFWSYEDTTSRTWTVQSAKHLEAFVQNVARVFSDSQPHTILEERWAQFALNLALSSPSRHYAGRSLQVFRALRVPVSLRMISDILSRLVETVAEQGEDMQGYVTELILTLESAIDCLDTDFRPIDMARDIFKSTPNLCKEAVGPKKQYAGVAGKLYSGWRDPTGHIRSTSYSVAYNSRRIVGSPAMDRRDFMRNRSSTDCEVRRGQCGNLFRSRSANSLKGLGDVTSQEDKLTILAQLFWIAVCLLQSDFEHEFLLALKLLQKVLEKFPLDRPDCRDKVEKLLVHLKWTNFPGVHSLLLKGLTNPNTYEQTIGAVSSLTKLLNVSVIDPTGGSAFAFSVMALLPYMLAHYEDANELCVRSAENIAQVSTDLSQKLENLATVMTLYSRRTFSKESFQWTKCVVKYLYDSFSTLAIPIVSFLVEVLEKGPTLVHLPIVTILHSLLHYIDLSSSSTGQQVNIDLMRITAKHMEGAYWKEALKIIKLVVTRSSSLVAPPYGESSSLTGPISLDSDIFLRKELPGRTMEFSYDLEQTPVIGRKAEGGKTQEPTEKRPGHVSPRRSVSLGSADGNSVSGWKRPWLCQTRVRESLVNLLTSCGQKVGLPKSPSVIFSQGSDPLERQSSLASSMDEVSGQGNDHSGDSKLDDSIATEQQLRVFKDFDFLEYELESSEGDGMDRFNWGVQRHSLSNLDVDTAGRDNFRDSISASDGTHRSINDVGLEESSDDEVGSVSPLDETIPESPRPLPHTLTVDIADTSGNQSDSSHDECSEGDGGDVTPCNVSPSIPLIPNGTFRPIGTPTPTPFGLASDEVDSAWKCQIQNLLSESSVTPELVLNTLQIFGTLFKESRARIALSVQECQECLTSVESSSGRLSIYPLIVDPVSSAADILGRQIEYPFIYCDQSVLAGSRLLDRLKFGLLELHERYGMCVDKKEHLVESLNLVQPTLGTSLGSNYTEVPYEDQIVDIGNHTHKLLFQSLLLFETYVKVLGLVQSATKHCEGVDLTGDVEAIYNGLSVSIEDEEIEPDSELDHEMSRSQAEFTLIELLINKRYSKAMKHVWQYRYLWPSGYFGNSAEEEIRSIINIYCKYQSDKKGGSVYALFYSEEKLEELCEKLMENVLQIQSTLKSAEHGNIGISNTIMKTEC